jgi:hypothetical protein
MPHDNSMGDLMILPPLNDRILISGPDKGQQQHNAKMNGR